MKPKQVWITLTCYLDHEQEAADALREAFARAGIAKQLLEVVVQPKADTSQTVIESGIEQLRQARFEGTISAKVAQTDAAAAVIRSGPGSLPFAGWRFKDLPRNTRNNPVKNETAEPLVKFPESVRVLVWPFEGFLGQVVFFNKKTAHISVMILYADQVAYLSLYEDEVAKEPGAKPMSGGYPYRAWYVLYGYPGKEEVLRDNLRKRLDESGLLGQLFDVLIPQQEQDTIALVRDGKEHIISPKLFPGAVFVLMAMSKEAWRVIRQTTGLTGFVGSGDRPLAYLPASAADQASQVSPTAEGKPPANRGDQVRILSGPFRDFRAVVVEVHLEQSKLRVMVDFFTRPTPVMLDFNQVEKI